MYICIYVSMYILYIYMHMYMYYIYICICTSAFLHPFSLIECTERVSRGEAMESKLKATTGWLTHLFHSQEPQLCQRLVGVPWGFQGLGISNSWVAWTPRHQDISAVFQGPGSKLRSKLRRQHAQLDASEPRICFGSSRPFHLTS